MRRRPVHPSAGRAIHTCTSGQTNPGCAGGLRQRDILPLRRPHPILFAGCTECRVATCLEAIHIRDATTEQASLLLADSVHMTALVLLSVSPHRCSCKYYNQTDNAARQRRNHQFESFLPHRCTVVAALQRKPLAMHVLWSMHVRTTRCDDTCRSPQLSLQWRSPHQWQLQLLCTE